MELQVFRHLWGVTEPLKTLLPSLRGKGYVGVEAPVPPMKEQASFREQLAAYHLSYIAQIATSGRTVADHLASFRQGVADAQALHPTLINSHSGRDAWGQEERSTFFHEIVHIEADMPMPIAHETHRGRIFFHPWATAAVLQEFPTIKLGADFSHWVCVCERLLDEESELMAFCATRSLHIHARVGYEEGPQVSDPRAPEYAAHVTAHERWWDAIWQSQRAQGAAISTLTPEFGPPAYLHTLPYTQMPITNLSTICDWQTERQRHRFVAATSENL